MKNQSKPKSLALLAFAALVLGGGATYFQYQSVQAARAEVLALESQVPSQKELQQSLSESNMKLVEYQRQLEHLEKSVPDVAYIPTLLKDLEQVGLSHGIKVTGVRPAPQAFMQPAAPLEEGKKEKKKEYAEVEIEVKGRGNYDQLKAFLDALQKFPKILAVKTVSLSPIRESNREPVGQLEATVNVVAYVFPFEMLTGEAQPKPEDELQGEQSQPGEQTSTSEATGAQTIAKKGGRN